MVKATTTSILRAAAVLVGTIGAAAPMAAEEVLPWATSSPVAATAETPDDPAMQSAIAQCTGQFEAGCRDLKTCAWVADVRLQDGTLVPARCVALRPAPPKSTTADAGSSAVPAPTPPPKKKAAATPPPPKAAAKEAPAAQQPAAVKAATVASETETGALPDRAEPNAAPKAPVAPVVVTRPQPETPPVAEKKEAAPAEAEAKAAAIEAPASPPALPVNRNAPMPVTTTVAPVAEKKTVEKVEKKEAAPAEEKQKTKQVQGPAGATPPKSGEAPKSPSFGSFSSAFPMGGAVVTTTVPPRSTE